MVSCDPPPHGGSLNYDLAITSLIALPNSAVPMKDARHFIEMEEAEVWSWLFTTILKLFWHQLVLRLSVGQEMEFQTFF